MHNFNNYFHPLDNTETARRGTDGLKQATCTVVQQYCLKLCLYRPAVTDNETGRALQYAT